MIVPLLLLFGTHAAAASNILVIGDSMGEYSCGSRGDPDTFPGPNHLQEFCPGARVHNFAVSGSTAWSWRADGGANSVAAAFDAVRASDGGADPVTHVWLSVGGNDFMQPHEQAEGAPGADRGACQISSTDLVARIAAAVDAVKSAAASATVKIVLTGYCVPHQPECDGQTDMGVLHDAYTQVAAGYTDVEYNDISTVCGGSKTQVGDAQFFVDPIHLNKRGYCAVFTQTNVFSAFGCDASAWSGGSLDCSAVGAVSCTGAGGDADFGSHAGSGSEHQGGEDEGLKDQEETGHTEESEVIDITEFNAAIDDFQPAYYPHTMTLSALVTVSGALQANGTLVAMEEHSETIRGVQSTPSFPPFGTYANQAVYQIMLYGEGGGSNDRLRFVFVSDIDYRAVHLQQTVSFVANGNEGSVTEPFVFTGSFGISSNNADEPHSNEGGYEGEEEGEGAVHDGAGGASDSSGDGSTNDVFATSDPTAYCGPGTEFVESSYKCEVTYSAFVRGCGEASIEGCNNIAVAADCPAP